ncbi:MAG: hypothetical protein JWP15_1059 [Alphaproteobacteria bacterium]|nr:hypothetical protein [Alphaproteobacteria bacterium]
MSNVAGKAYGMNVVTPMRPAVTWFNRLIFMFARALPATFGGLLGLSLIHFARWVIIRRDQWPERGQKQSRLGNDYMLFCSNFNGTWDQYIDAFADGIPGGLDLFWYSSTKYPNSIPVTPFKDYIRANQLDTGYYYNATPGSAQRDIKLALTLAKALREVDPGADDATLAEIYQAILLQSQGGLGAPGYAPIASCDTSMADQHRCAAVHDRWGPHGKGPPPAEHVLDAVPLSTVLASSANQGEAQKQAVRDAVAAVVHDGKKLSEPPPAMPPATPRAALAPLAETVASAAPTAETAADPEKKDA